MLITGENQLELKLKGVFFVVDVGPTFPLVCPNITGFALHCLYNMHFCTAPPLCPQLQHTWVDDH